MAVTSHNDGTYTVTWVPTSPGSYDIRVCIDGSLAGESHTYEVLPAIPSETDQKEEEEEEEETATEGSKEDEDKETFVIETIKRKIFTGEKAQGVRVRAQPSFAAPAVGLIKPGYVLCYTDEVENDAGTWVKLTYESLMELKCTKKEGYALAYSKAKNDEFLEYHEPKEVKRTIKKKGKVDKRKDGPGTYTVVQCGAAGHNIRSKPNMKGCPLGRLSKGSIINAVEEAENDDGIWLKLSPESVLKYTQQHSPDPEGWTLVVHPSGRIFLAQDGDESYQSNDFQSSSAAFPTAASVFGTPSSSATSLFGSSEAPPLPPRPPGAKGPVKLAFGGQIDSKDNEGLKESEGSPLTGEDKGEEKKEKGEEKKEKGEEEKVKQATASLNSRRRRVTIKTDKEDKIEEEKEKEDEKPSDMEKSDVTLQPHSSATPPKKRQALSPAVAECQRAIYAAFLWQEGLVHDAMASSLYIKFHPSVIKEEELTTPTNGEKGGAAVSVEGGKSDEKLPATLHHLVTFWEEMSQKVIDQSSLSFSPPKVPSYAQELLKRYEEEKKEMEKLKKEKEKKSGGGASPAGGGATKCELCDVSFPDPVTYHMKDAHSGCGNHANGWGYNSRGSYCSGWAGNCGDGGRGGSTWYLMCKECHAKYLAQKEENKKKVVKPISVPKMKTRKPGKARSLPVMSSVQGMLLNAKFLLEVSTRPVSGEGPKSKTTPLPTGGAGVPDLARQVSTPDDSVVGVVSDITETSVFSHPDKSKEEPPLRSSLPRPIPALGRSISMATGGADPTMKRTFSDSGEEPVPTFNRQLTGVGHRGSEGVSSSLMHKPSMALANLMYMRSISKDDSGYERIMKFIGTYHDLLGLKTTMKHMMRIASLRATALEFFEWLLLQVDSPSVVHDILWQFVRSVSDHPMIQAAATAKALREEEESEEKESESKDLSLGRNPLTGLDGSGFMMQKLRNVFHSFLQTIANKMSKLPVGSVAQQIALRCWCLDFQSQDHSFLLQSHVFANISEALSVMEEVEGDKVASNKTQSEPVVQLMINILHEGKLKVSSNDGMSNSLTDGSTETFWESRDEPRGKPRTITLAYERKIKPFGACIHIDNTKDSGQRVEQLALLVGPDEDGLKEVDKCKLSTGHSGWKTLTVPADIPDISLVRFELRGSQNNVRARQVALLEYPELTHSASNGAVNSELAMQKDCEAEALRLFRLLTSQVFGGLLDTQHKPTEQREETDTGDQSEGGGGGVGGDEETSSMANILFNKSKLSNLQKAVCQHIMDSVHKETIRIKGEWEEELKNPKPTATPPSRQASQDPSYAEEGSSPSKSPDAYCSELLTMLSGLSQNELGCAYLADQAQLVKDLTSLLHTASTKIQLQVCSLLRFILPYIKPREFATMTDVTVLPPLGYSAIAEAVNSASTINQLGLLDCLLAVIAKALSVQVKVKGRGSNILQKLTGDSTITAAVTLAALKNPKPVAGETHVRPLRWYLQGSIEQEVAIEIVKLLKDMTKSVLKGHWKDYAKSAIGQAVLHLTKVNEEARNADPGMYSHTFWLCLAALCVIDEEHAEALSSGQWLGQDGKPQTKPLCDNHDDGETKALILCDVCGNLCGECDRVLHYHKKNRHHNRQVFKEEEEAVKVDLHEGCGRIKLYWTMALADSRTLKGMVEFKDTVGGSGKGACRFCGTTSNTGLLAIGNVCPDPECQERSRSVCTKTLSCGHYCCGVKDEKKCLPCLHGCVPKEGVTAPPLKQDADDMCMICYTEGLSCAPSIQLECGHVFHYHCCRDALSKKWSGPRITFRFMFCSICEDKPISHPHLEDVSKPLTDLYSDVTRKCLLRLEYENQTKCEAVTSPTSKFYQKPQEYAMWKYAYYVCYKCKKAYYGGEAHCAEAVGSDDYDPTELVCPSCSNTGGQLQVCPKHGTDFLEYKCRYCCSVAVYFCFGTTHFCNPCHDDFQRVTSIAKSDLPQCPVGPRAKPLSGSECPLHVKHPPTGEEFALGCGVCRNAQTF
ncbi:PREDICTED: E3 ubiquitin-protein ligase MYCBP2-like isoform X1 [Amphimedon queenslandica]|uniref:RCR-type E3 ubiquitin transferase n=1 Tax=Amphimedon queenslandica TaxID=400682 RepID=A0AAN0JDF6_AMPQE|nr:PREDICTED: E3 ubiquitin-protein ligase MYCBP2-like isoform X1 [Amphimedon queenslandica]|eukprot:XP_019855060.1 PREDICTED: E3 ubiquitin-protein ligase MYCBP2-like isoform X1 [Amphimedon queenslandica]